MAPAGAATLRLKASTIVVVLAVLVLPSLGRCPSLGPEAPPPPPVPGPPPPPSALTPGLLPPAPAPAPGQPMLCSDCFSNCNSTCTASIPSEQCYAQCGVGCERCKSAVMQDCMDTCKGRCDCNLYVWRSCNGLCSSGTGGCKSCMDEYGPSCRDSCVDRDCAGCME